jgi:hypothetical protein
MLRITHERCILWRQNNPEVNYSPIRISGAGGGGLFLGEVSRSRKKVSMEAQIILVLSYYFIVIISAIYVTKTYRDSLLSDFVDPAHKMYP